jgi:capsular polysaccharide biosynthesis protein
MQNIMNTVFGQKTFSRLLPLNLRHCDRNYFEKIQTYNCPSLRIHKFSTVNILPDGTLFKAIFPLKESFLYFEKRIKHHNAKGIAFIRLNWKRKNLNLRKTLLIIHDVWTQNYYHWITQALPRLIISQQTGLPFILLLPDDHQSDFHIASLKLLGVTSWQTLERKEHFYHVNNLLLPSRDIQVGDYNDDLICILRDRLRLNSNSTESKRIFIRRVVNDKRRIINEEDVIAIFLSFGFAIIEFERLTFLEQLTLLKETKVLAGVHGAGLTNMIFMPNDGITFELTTQLNGANYYFFSLSNALSHRYYYQVCQTDNPATVQEANLLVDIEDLKKNLDLILSH